MQTTEDIYSVTVKIINNGEKLITTTFTSDESYDHCHQKIEKYIKKHTKESDKVETHILNTNHFTTPITY